MGSKSDDLENLVLDILYGNNQGLEPKETLSIALYTETPTDAGGGVEVSGTGYERKEISNIPLPPPQDSTFEPAINGVKRNAVAIEFAQAGAGGWGTVVAFAIFAPGEPAMMLHWGAVDPPVEVNNNDIFRIPIGGLVISED